MKPPASAALLLSKAASRAGKHTHRVTVCVCLPLQTSIATLCGRRLPLLRLSLSLFACRCLSRAAASAHVRALTLPPLTMLNITTNSVPPPTYKETFTTEFASFN